MTHAALVAMLQQRTDLAPLADKLADSVDSNLIIAMLEQLGLPKNLAALANVLSYPLDIISVCIESAGTQPDPILTLHASQVGLAQRVRRAACARDSSCYVRV